MNKHDEKIRLYFELNGTPESSQESYWRRMKAVLNYLEENHKSMDDVNFEDIQQNPLS